MQASLSQTLKEGVTRRLELSVTLKRGREGELSGQGRGYWGITELSKSVQLGSAVAWSVRAEEAQVCGSCSRLPRRSLAASIPKAWEYLYSAAKLPPHSPHPVFQALPAFLLCS